MGDETQLDARGRLSCPACGSKTFHVKRDSEVPQVSVGFYCTECGNDTGGYTAAFDQRVSEAMVDQ